MLIVVFHNEIYGDHSLEMIKLSAAAAACKSEVSRFRRTLYSLASPSLAVARSMRISDAGTF